MFQLGATSTLEHGVNKSIHVDFTTEKRKRNRNWGVKSKLDEKHPRMQEILRQEADAKEKALVDGRPRSGVEVDLRRALRDTEDWTLP